MKNWQLVTMLMEDDWARKYLDDEAELGPRAAIHLMLGADA